MWWNSGSPPQVIIKCFMAHTTTRWPVKSSKLTKKCQSYDAIFCNCERARAISKIQVRPQTFGSERVMVVPGTLDPFTSIFPYHWLFWLYLVCPSSSFCSEILTSLLRLHSISWNFIAAPKWTLWPWWKSSFYYSSKMDCHFSFLRLLITFF